MSVQCDKIAFMNTIHERLAWARENAGIRNMADAARMLGASEPSYRAHETGFRNPRAPTVKAYAKAFNVNWVWLMHGEGEPLGSPDPASAEAPLPDLFDGPVDEAQLHRGLLNLRTILDQGLQVAPLSGYTLALGAAQQLVEVLELLNEMDGRNKSRPNSTSTP